MKNKKAITIEIIGWLGALFIITAFALNSFGIIETNSLIYPLLNLVGAVGVIVVSVYKKVYQTVVINTLWIAVATIAITKWAISRGN